MDSAAFHLQEVYADVEAFDAHAVGPCIAAYAEGPRRLMKGNVMSD